MGPEAALVSERLAAMRRLGGYAGDLPACAVPMYAEVAARARLEPPTYRPGVLARLRAAFHGRGAPARGREAAWTVAAAAIAVKEERRGGAPDLGMADALLAALPLQPAAKD